MRPARLPGDRGSGSGVISRLRDAGLHPRKALGQHFLHDPRLLAAIVDDAGVTTSDRVLEVGTGPGTLTREIALRAEGVLTVEMDPAILAFARRELEDLENVRFLQADVLEGKQALRREVVDAVEELGPFLWVSNLPYGLAATLIVLVCESSLRWARAALTVQEEVAERICAAPGEPGYGPTSALIAYRVSARRGRRIPPGAFWPPPEVNSRVLHLVPVEPAGSPAEYPAYRAWVKRLFSSRRKQVQRLLRDALGEGGAEEALAAGGWEPTLRPDSLAPRDFLLLAREFPLPGNPGARGGPGKPPSFSH